MTMQCTLHLIKGQKPLRRYPKTKAQFDALPLLTSKPIDCSFEVDGFYTKDTFFWMNTTDETVSVAIALLEVPVFESVKYIKVPLPTGMHYPLNFVPGASLTLKWPENAILTF